MREILFVAGEVSGDLHAAAVARELDAKRVPFKLTGVGGDQMLAAGVELIEHSEKLAVMGFVEVLEYLPKLLRLFRRLKGRISSGEVAAVVLIDYPDFNMFVARAASAAGVPVLYYITPQVWAWRAGRVDTLAKTVTRAAVILPFEEPLLRARGVDAIFVGHPLMDRVAHMPDRDEARQLLGISPDARLLALFPGSRRQEIERHLDPFVAVARELQRRDPTLEVIVSAAPHVTIDAGRCPFRTVQSASLTVLRASDAALCKSGTTTLEATVAGCPFVIAYRTSAFSYVVGKLLVKIPHIGLVNVVAGRRVAPEFVQGELQPLLIAEYLAPLLDPTSIERRTMLAELATVRESLGRPGAAVTVANLALSLAQQRRGSHGR